MKTIVSFACILIVIACTTVKPTETKRDGGGHYGHLTQEEIDEVYNCARELGGNSDRDATPDVQKMWHILMFYCDLQRNGVLDKCEMDADALDEYIRGVRKNSNPDA